MLLAQNIDQSPQSIIFKESFPRANAALNRNFGKTFHIHSRHFDMSAQPVELD